MRIVGDTYSQQIDKIRNDTSPKVHYQVVSKQDLPVLLQVRVSEKDKIRIDVPPIAPVKSCSLLRSNSLASTTNSTQPTTVSSKISLHKSQSFCADKVYKFLAMVFHLLSNKNRQE